MADKLDNQDSRNRPGSAVPARPQTVGAVTYGLAVMFREELPDDLGRVESLRGWRAEAGHRPGPLMARAGDRDQLDRAAARACGDRRPDYPCGVDHRRGAMVETAGGRSSARASRSGGTPWGGSRQ